MVKYLIPGATGTSEHNTTFAGRERRACSRSRVGGVGAGAGDTPRRKNCDYRDKVGKADSAVQSGEGPVSRVAQRSV